MSKLIILRGNSGSGKTSVAKALQRRFGRNTMVISQDTVRREMLWAKDGEGTKAVPLLICLLKYGRRNSEITILEGILHSEFYMSVFEAAIGEYGSDIFAYYYDLPFEETLLRHSMRQSKFDFGEEHMRKWWKDKDFLSVIPEKILSKDVTLEAAVDMIFDDVSNA